MLIIRTEHTSICVMLLSVREEASEPPGCGLLYHSLIIITCPSSRFLWPLTSIIARTLQSGLPLTATYALALCYLTCALSLLVVCCAAAIFTATPYICLLAGCVQAVKIHHLCKALHSRMFETINRSVIEHCT